MPGDVKVKTVGLTDEGRMSAISAKEAEAGDFKLKASLGYVKLPS